MKPCKPNSSSETLTSDSTYSGLFSLSIFLVKFWFIKIKNIVKTILGNDYFDLLSVVYIVSTFNLQDKVALLIALAGLKGSRVY